jgi:RNA polymerase sigma-70 factor, ECF subfamily
VIDRAAQRISCHRQARARAVVARLELQLNPPVSTSVSGTLQSYRYPTKLAAPHLSPLVDQSALLAALRSGDSSAQADVFNLYEPAVRRVLMRILRERQDVQDALQDTFVKIFNSASQVKDPMALKGWILKVATSVGLDEYRRRQRSREHRLSDHDSCEPSALSAPLEVRRALRDAYRVLSVLPEQEQQVFTLRYIDGLELEKIADVCDISLATVKRRLGRAADRFNSLARRQPALTEWVAAD